MTSGNALIDAPTRQDAVYATLRQWLTVGRFLPGERLKIRDVAAAMGVGLMPVRAALQRLAAEGALIGIPNAGVAVPRLSLAEFDDLLNLRILLEGEAAERGSRQIKAGAKRQLGTLARRMQRALKARRAAEYLAANEDFHVILYRAAGSPLLFQLIDTLWLKAGPISNQLFDTPSDTAILNDSHQAMLAALDAQDYPAVRRAIERDILTAGRLLRRQFE